VKQTFTLIIKYYDKKHTKRFSSSSFTSSIFAVAASLVRLLFLVLLLPLLLYFYTNSTHSIEKWVEKAEIVQTELKQAKKSLFLALFILISNLFSFMC
jgi:Ca2+/Na+ antiporter